MMKYNCKLNLSLFQVVYIHYDVNVFCAIYYNTCLKSIDHPKCYSCCQ